jgi:hypothetical protein
MINALSGTICTAESVEHEVVAVVGPEVKAAGGNARRRLEAR